MPRASALLHVRSFAGLGTAQIDKNYGGEKGKPTRQQKNLPGNCEHALTQIVHPALRPSAWEWCELTGAYPEDDTKKAPRAGALLFFRQKAGGAYPGEEKV